jgi:hypothetical protein
MFRHGKVARVDHPHVATSLVFVGCMAFSLKVYGTGALTSVAWARS